MRRAALGFSLLAAMVVIPAGAHASGSPGRAAVGPNGGLVVGGNATASRKAVGPAESGGYSVGGNATASR